MKIHTSRGPTLSHQISRAPAVSRARSPLAIAGPGPNTLAAMADGGSRSTPEHAIGGYHGSAAVRTRLGDLDADGEDDPDAMEGVEEVVRQFVQSRGQSDSEDPSEVGGRKTKGPSQAAVPNPTFGTGKGKQRAPKPMQDAVPNPTLSLKAKGKQRARPETDHEREVTTLSDVTDNSGWSSWQDRVIVSRPPPRERKPQQPRKPVRTQPSGRVYDPPCLNCRRGSRRGELECEEPRGGGACIGCKRKKQGCQYALLVAKKKVVKSKPQIESEDDDSDGPISTARPRPSVYVSLPPITTLSASSPSHPTQLPSGPKPSPRLPTRAPPLREARIRATRAIQAAAAVQVTSPPIVEPRPMRRRSPSGTRTRMPVSGIFAFSCPTDLYPTRGSLTVAGRCAHTILHETR